MFAKSITKTPIEEFDISFQFISKDPNTTYQVQKIIVVDITDKQGVDHFDTMIDLQKSYCLEDTAYLWLKGGASNNLYNLTCYIQLTNGQIRDCSAQVLVI